MIFITGEHASGKTHLSKYLVDHFSYEYIDLGPTLREYWRQSGFSGKFGDFMSMGESKYGTNFADDILVDAVGKKLRICSNRELLVSGSRSIEGIRYLSEHLSIPLGRSSKIVYVESAHPNILLRRYNNREQKSLTIQEFEKLLSKDRDMGVLGIKPFADWLIHNDGAVELFEARCNQLHTDIYNYRKSVEGGYWRGKEY